MRPIFEITTAIGKVYVSAAHVTHMTTYHSGGTAVWLVGADEPLSAKEPLEKLLDEWQACLSLLRPSPLGGRL